MKILAKFVEWIERSGALTPYFNLHHADGSLYMRRMWLMPRFLLMAVTETDMNGMIWPMVKPLDWLPFSVRLHWIETADADRDMHDHPSTFLSIVLRGGYVERRPMFVEPKRDETGEELHYDTTRGAGSVAIRRFYDRHRIVSVEPGTVTLVVWFRKRQFWGFFTPLGKVHWTKYESVHNTTPIR